jgi:hypothetical protein
VIGRRFDPLSLAVVADDAGEIEVRLAAMQGLDLVRPESGGDYAFKHALVRDALYQSLLTGPRAALHLKIAEEIEGRAGNRLPGVVETLAHHFGQTDRADKAFKYLAMAGAKSNGVYSLDEAQRHFADAIVVLERTPDCASDMQIAELLADFTLCSNLSMRMTLLTETVARFLPLLLRLGDIPERVLVNHHYVGALLQLGRFQEARQAQIDLTSIGLRLGDPRSLAYDLSNAMFVSTIVAPTSIDTSERQARELLGAASATDDPYIQVFSRFVVAWDELHRGHLVKARAWAQELIDLGQRLNDPRSLGFGLNVQAWIALLGDNYPLALNLAEASNDVARVNFDKESIKNIMKTVGVLLRQTEAHQALQN